MNVRVEDYISAKTPEFAAALAQLRAMLREILPDHIEVMSYAMPGLRAPIPDGKMIIGYAAFAKHIGLYPHSGNVIDKINCAPYKTSKSGIIFAPGGLPPARWWPPSSLSASANWPQATQLQRASPPLALSHWLKYLRAERKAPQTRP
jgi:uncharacterized protein YdhG (YjbR/CyaY superfamily)